MADDMKRLAVRDSYRRKLVARLTCEQRLARMEALQIAAFELLHQNPEGYRRFLKRNYARRAVRPRP